MVVSELNVTPAPVPYPAPSVRTAGVSLFRFWRMTSWREPMLAGDSTRKRAPVLIWMSLPATFAPAVPAPVSQSSPSWIVVPPA